MTKKAARRRKPTPRKEPSVNGHTPAQQVRDAIAKPSVPEIVPRTLNPSGGRVTEIGARTKGEAPDDGSRPVVIDPAMMMAPISKPSEFSWLRLFPERTLTTLLLAYKVTQDSSADFYYVTEELEAPVSQFLKEVEVHLCWDANDKGFSFLWIFPRSSFSPYYNTMARALAMGKEFVDGHLFRFGKASIKSKTCSLEERLPRPTDPTMVVPTRSVSKLLPEALGLDRCITTATHPVYASVTAGRRVP
jgi:hypothetical protein